MSSFVRRRSRIAHFKAPFLLSVASAAASVGCGGRTPGDNGDDSALEGDGTALSGDDTALNVGCTTPAPEARYSPGCGVTLHPVCVDGEWREPLIACNPPPPWTTGQPIGCPEEMPIAGSDCEPPHAASSGIAWDAFAPPPTCRYPGCEGPTASTASCVGGQWLVQYSSGPACNPPAVTPVCPEAPIVAGNVCAYEGQRCNHECSGYVCSDGNWQHGSLSCPLPAADAGAAPLPDAGP